MWAQAQREIPLLGTTHADLCAHPIPLTRALTEHEIEDDYEGNTGVVLIEAISERGPEELPCAPNVSLNESCDSYENSRSIRRSL